MASTQTTREQTVPFIGPDGSGHAPPGSFPRMRLLIEGWRFLPHSYSIVNQWQCLELLRRPNVELMHRDVPVFKQLGERVMGILPPEDEDRIAAIPPPSGEFDAVYRIGYPYDFAPSRCPNTFVFATCERMLLKPIDVLSPPEIDGRMARAFAQRIRDNGLTVITPSEWSRSGLVRSGIDPDRIVVVPHGIEPSVFRPLDPAKREEMRRDRNQTGTFSFLHVSAMTGNKNLEGIVRGFLEIASRHKHARLILKGLDGMFRSDRWVSQELGSLGPAERALAKRTIFYSGLPLTLRDQVALYQLSDAYIAPYQSEGFNIPVLEAAACGLPVITTKGGPTDEFTTPEFCLPIKARFGDHFHDGFQWFDADQNSVVEQMERAITDDSWRSGAAVSGPRHAHANYSWSAVVDRLLSVIGSRVLT